MDFSQDDFDRLLLFEHTRKTAEANYAENPLDADVRIFLSFTSFFCFFICYNDVQFICMYFFSILWRCLFDSVIWKSVF